MLPVLWLIVFIQTQKYLFTWRWELFSWVTSEPLAFQGIMKNLIHVIIKFLLFCSTIAWGLFIFCSHLSYSHSSPLEGARGSRVPAASFVKHVTNFLDLLTWLLLAAWEFGKFLEEFFSYSSPSLSLNFL